MPQFNLLATLMAAVAGLATASVLGLPPVLGTVWMNAVKDYTNLSDEELHPSLAGRLGGLGLAMLVNAFFLDALLRMANVTGVGDGLFLAVSAWAGLSLSLGFWPV